MQSGTKRWLSAIVVAAVTCVGLGASARGEFPLKEGDTWVMSGDSITAQHLHTNYFEAFCYARYPQMKFCFRNSGVGGDTIGSLSNRFAWDVAAWKPTVVSVELGMNDQGGTTPEQYIVNMGKLTEKIRACSARPVFFTASPVNNGDNMAKLAARKGGGDFRLEQFATKLKEFAATQNAPFADQFHDLLEVWSVQKEREIRAGWVTTVKAASADEKLVGVEHLRAFLTEQEKSPIPAYISMGGDAVHPGPPGQLTMAASLLKALGADGFVSSATVEASGKAGPTKGCVIDGVKAEKGILSFDRLDECLPFPIPDDARAVIAIYPTILDLSQYTLKVTGLVDGRYDVKIDGKPAATLTAAELAAGVNLTSLPQGAIAAQMKEVLAAVSVKEGVVGAWRSQSKGVVAAATAPATQTELQAKLAETLQKVQDADAKIREAAKPRKLHFEISAAAAVPTK